MNKHLLIYGIWLVLVIAWNYGYPGAAPWMDVAAAIVLAAFSTLSIHRFVHKKDWR